MKNDYRIKVRLKNGSEILLSFYSTRLQVEKVFFAFVSATCCSDVAFAALYLCHRSGFDLLDCNELLNRVGASEYDK